MPGVSGVTVVTTLVCFFICMRGCGRIERPAFPAPSVIPGRMVFAKPRAHRAAGSRSHILNLECRHSGAMRSIEPGISRFPDVQLHIWGLVLAHHPGMTEYRARARASGWLIGGTMRFSAVRGASRRIYTAAPFG